MSDEATLSHYQAAEHLLKMSDEDALRALEHLSHGERAKAEAELAGAKCSIASAHVHATLAVADSLRALLDEYGASTDG